LVEVVCDTSFLMILASKNVKNISNLDTEIGAIEFTVPDMVINELERLSKDTNLKKKLPLLMH
jgi:rRNA-processing protein FCF1